MVDQDTDYVTTSSAAAKVHKMNFGRLDESDEDEENNSDAAQISAADKRANFSGVKAATETFHVITHEKRVDVYAGEMLARNEEEHKRL